jgi:hypothetical protein
MDAVTATPADAAELLHVHVDELAGTGALVTADDPTGRPVQVVEPGEVVTDEDGIDRRGRDPERGGDPVRALLLHPALLDDPGLQPGLGPRRGGMRPARAVDQAAGTELLVAAPPLRGALAGDPHLGGHVGDHPVLFDPSAEQESTCRGEWGVSVGHEDLREVVLASTPAHLHPEVFVLVDPGVNNVRGKYT